MALTTPIEFSGQKVTGFQQLTVSTVALGFTIPPNSNSAIFVCETNPIRFTLDGTTAPTAAIGVLVAAADVIKLIGAELIGKFKAIRQGGADAVLEIHYFG